VEDGDIDLMEEGKDRCGDKDIMEDGNSPPSADSLEHPPHHNPTIKPSSDIEPDFMDQASSEFADQKLYVADEAEEKEQDVSVDAAASDRKLYIVWDVSEKHDGSEGSKIDLEKGGDSLMCLQGGDEAIEMENSPPSADALESPPHHPTIEPTSDKMPEYHVHFQQGEDSFVHQSPPQQESQEAGGGNGEGTVIQFADESPGVVDKDEQQKQAPPAWKRIVWVLAFLLVIAVIAVVAGVLISNGRGESLSESSNESEVTPPFPPPTLAPTNPPSTGAPESPPSPPPTVAPTTRTEATESPPFSLPTFAPTNSPSTNSPSTKAPEFPTDLVERFKLMAGDGEEGDGFGFSVAIADDTVVVGSWQDDTDNGSRSGSVYVYVRTENAWTQQAKLTASDGDPNDEFGYSLSIAGDTLVVGSWQDDTDNGNSSGSAYVFRRTGTNWAEQAKLTASDGDAGDRFGTSVAIAGDTLVVGARNEDGNGPSNDNSFANSGSAYVYTRTGTTWTEQAKLIASNGAAGDQFGDSVAIDRDTIVVGAHLGDANGGAEDSGSAYVYARAGTTWTEEAKLTASDGEEDDKFGISVAIDGDTIVVGAHLDDANGGTEDSGSAYVYTRAGTTWTEEAKLTASDGVAGDEFGYSVAIAADTIVVG